MGIVQHDAMMLSYLLYLYTIHACMLYATYPYNTTTKTYVQPATMTKASYIDANYYQQYYVYTVLYMYYDTPLLSAHLRDTAARRPGPLLRKPDCPLSTGPVY